MQQTRSVRFLEWWQSAAREMKQLKSLVGAGLLAALGMVIKSFSIPIGQLFKISFHYLATALSGYLYGPVTAGFAAIVVDIFGYLLKPDGPYFPGFTLSAFVGGFVYGCWLYRKQVRLWRVAAACATNTLLVSLLLNPLWLNILYGQAFWGLLALRLPGNLMVLPVNTLLLYMVLRVVEKQKHLLVKR